MKTVKKNVSVNVKCPMCRESLMDPNNLITDKPSIKLNIEMGDKRGTIRLCSIYGCYEHSADIPILQNEIATFFCPYCNQQITDNDLCDACDAPMIPLIIAIGGKVSICSRSGCQEHFIAFKDIHDEMRKFYYSYEDY